MAEPIVSDRGQQQPHLSLGVGVEILVCRGDPVHPVGHIPPHQSEASKSAAGASCRSLPSWSSYRSSTPAAQLEPAPHQSVRPGRHRLQALGRRRPHSRYDNGPRVFRRWSAGRERHVSGRPIKARTREHYHFVLDDHLLPTFGHRQLGAIKPKDVRDWYAETLVGGPTMRSHAYSLLRTIFASVPELGLLTAAMPERLRLMVTLASWCALRLGETVELRRGEIDLSAEVIRIRRAAVRTKGSYSITTLKSDAGMRDVAIPPRVLPLIEAHLAKHVGNDCDSLVLLPASAKS